MTLKTLFSREKEPKRPQLIPESAVGRVSLVTVTVQSVYPKVRWVVTKDGEIYDSHDLMDLLIQLEAPGEDYPAGRATAYLNRKVLTSEGGYTTHGEELFPARVEVVVNGHGQPDRCFTLCCPVSNSLDGCWMSVGLDNRGLPAEISGICKVEILISPPMLQARIEGDNGDQFALFADSGPGL